MFTGSCTRRRCSGQPAGLGELGWGSSGPSPTLSPAVRTLRPRDGQQLVCSKGAWLHAVNVDTQPPRTHHGAACGPGPWVSPRPCPNLTLRSIEVYLQPWLAYANDSPSRLSKECFMPGTSQGPQHINDSLGLQSRTGGLGRAVPLPSLSVPAPRGGAQAEDRENRGSFWGQRFQISQHRTLVMSWMEHSTVYMGGCSKRRGAYAKIPFCPPG